VLLVPSSAPAAVHTVTLRVDGFDRTYRLFSPDAPQTPTATVFAFHGGGGTAAEFAASTGLDDVAQRHGWAVVYPQGFRGHWNTGPCCSRARDDVRFFDEIRRDLTRRRLPSDRVGLVGFSEGGFLAYRLACVRAGVVARLGIVASTMVFRPCRPARGVDVVTVWNALDTRVPLAGRNSYGPGLRLASQAEVSRFWRRENRCRQLSWSAARAVTVYRGRRCAERAGYAAYVVRGTSHGWPGDLRTPSSVSATDVIAAAFDDTPAIR
jgi:polyhydroxybutyrate depolymerase